VSDLSPRARDLFEAGRRSQQPTAADRERVFASLSARVGGLEPRSRATSPPPARAGSVGMPAITAAVFGLALAGAGAYALFHSAAPRAVAVTPSNVASAHADPPAAPAAPAPADPAAASPSAEPSESSRVGARSVAAAPGNDRLAEEVAILSQAERDLNAGNYQSALRVLDEHRHKFPNGTLAQERMAARVQALCGLGRVSEAQVALARLTRVSPNSPHQERAREACPIKH
jgi:hypothetical protein